jgi:myosin heavy chain 6/7
MAKPGDLVDLNDPEVIDSFKYLFISPAEKIRLSSLPFDGKKQCWVPDSKEGFIDGEIVGTKGEEISVKTSRGETLNFKKDDVQQMNPPKYERCEDMADMTYLNDASVLHNLRQRYMNWMIYVSDAASFY